MTAQDAEPAVGSIVVRTDPSVELIATSFPEKSIASW